MEVTLSTCARAAEEPKPMARSGIQRIISTIYIVDTLLLVVIMSIRANVFVDLAIDTCLAGEKTRAGRKVLRSE